MLRGILLHNAHAGVKGAVAMQADSASIVHGSVVVQYVHCTL